MMKHSKRNWLAISKLTWGILQILNWALGSLKHLQFNGLLLTKVYNVWAKKVQGSYLSWHQRVMKNLKKNWLVLPNMTWEICQIFTRAPEVSKFGYWWDPFIQSKKYMSLKFTRELCVMTMKNDKKFKE